MDQRRWSDGKAVQFCAFCLKKYGYPTAIALQNGRGARQSVTVIGGTALCELHYKDQPLRK